MGYQVVWFFERAYVHNSTVCTVLAIWKNNFITCNYRVNSKKWLLFVTAVTTINILVSRNFGYHWKPLIMLIQRYLKFRLTNMLVIVITVIVTSKWTEYTMLYDSNVFQICFKKGQYSDNWPTLCINRACIYLGQGLDMSGHHWNATTWDHIFRIFHLAMQLVSNISLCCLDCVWNTGSLDFKLDALPIELSRLVPLSSAWCHLLSTIKAAFFVS